VSRSSRASPKIIGSGRRRNRKAAPTPIAMTGISTSIEASGMAISNSVAKANEFPLA